MLEQLKKRAHNSIGPLGITTIDSRRQRNKKSAKRYRDRRKAYISELENTAVELLEQLQYHEQELEVLRRENACLQHRVSLLEPMHRNSFSNYIPREPLFELDIYKY